MWTRLPPRLAERLVRLALPRDDVGLSILGDLREELAAGLSGATSPALWYWRQALGLAVRFSAMRLAQAWKPARAPALETRPHRRHAPGGDGMIETLRQDLRYALRTFAKNPAFTAVALTILTLGIGATTAIFSVVDAVLVKSLPYEDPERLVRVRHGHAERGFAGVEGGGGFSPQDFEDLAADATSFERIAAYRFVPGHSTANLVGDGPPERIDGVPMEVVGVMPASFRFPSPEAEAWAPITRITDDMIPHRRGLRWMQSVARLAPGVTAEGARAETATILSRLAETHPDSNEGWTAAEVTPLRDSLVGAVRPALLVLLAATAFVLLVACANLANLLLARGTGRGREIAVRMSLGAGRTRLVRQLLTESLALSVAGGVLGLALASWGVGVLVSMSAGTVPLAEGVGLDWRVVGFALLVSVLTGASFGLLPAWTTAGLSPAVALREGGAAARGGRRPALRGVLVAGETALAVVLVISAGLMMKSFWKLVRVDPGFETRSLLTLSIKVSDDMLAQENWIERLLAYQKEIREAVERVPGVLAVGASKTSPMSGGGEPFAIKTVDADGNERVIRAESGFQIVSPGYFEALGITVVAGRAFTEQDPPTRVVVNQALAEQYWPGEDPVGRLLGTGERKLEIVGVVADVHHEGMASPARSTLYIAPPAGPRSAMNLFVRTASPDPLAVAEAVRQAIWTVNPRQPISDVGRLSETVSADVAQPRFFTTLLAAFAGLALVLAALGIYGVVSYTVGQRTGELGLRMALGARRADVFRLVVSEAMLVCGAGLVLGLVGSLWASRVLSSLLYGVEPRDPSTFAWVAVLLVGVSFVASLVPATRATRVDPVSALRSE